MSELSKVNKGSETTKSAIKRKSAQTLPNNPSARGYSAEEIKRRFYQPIIDATNSALTEIDRVVEEVNNAITQVNSNLDTFIEATSIKESYKLNLDWTVWVKNSNSGMYEVTITNKQHGITNYKEIGVDMYLLDCQGNYIKVNQFEINTNGNIRCFHEFNSVGFVSVYVKREGFVMGNVLTDVDHIIGLSKVGKTNDYNDLDNKPDLSQLDSNEALLTNIINGTQKVNSSIHADNAKNADYSSVSGFTDNAVNAENSEKAVGDQFGVNIHNNYCKKNGTYPNVSVGTAESANKAKCDEAGNNILSSYAQQNGEYQSMTVGKAKEADMSTKALKDGNGAEIAKTYAKATGSYPNLTAGQATNAINDDLGRKISETYASGVSVAFKTIPIRFYVTSSESEIGNPLFFDNDESFDVEFKLFTGSGCHKSEGFFIREQETTNLFKNIKYFCIKSSWGAFVMCPPRYIEMSLISKQNNAKCIARYHHQTMTGHIFYELVTGSGGTLEGGFTYSVRFFN